MTLVDPLLLPANQGMLGDFIRLTDYVAVEALVNLTVRTNEVFLTELLKHRKAGLFETTVLFTEEGTAFAPTCEDIKVREILVNETGP